MKALSSEPDTDAQNPPHAAAVMRRFFALLGEKWTLAVLAELRIEARRFNELKREIPGVSQRMLTQTLRELERASLIERMVLSTAPPRVAYALAELGRDLFPHLHAMKEWAHLHEDKLRKLLPDSS
jgi:DNA-binding HxlR family transcriptional regulator